MSREAMQMALEALDSDNPDIQLRAAIALRQALETEQKPVAWISDSPTKGNGKQLHWTKAEAWRWSSNITPLYTAPKQWVGLTDDELLEFSYASQKIDVSNSVWFDRWGFARALEAKLKEKNA